MTNKQKLKQTVTSIKAIRKKYEEELEEQISTMDSVTQRKLLEKQLVFRELEFEKRKATVAFHNVDCYYEQLICNRKKRIQAVPICFLVTLYECDLKVAFPKDEIQIPYQLRGFWKMEKALQMEEELIHLQNKCQNTLLWEKRKITHEENKEKVEVCSKILEEFVSLRISREGMADIISYKGEGQVKLNRDNVKLDMVPLCKLLTYYYAELLKWINQYLKIYAYPHETEKFETIKFDCSQFMEKYFQIKYVIC